MYQGLQTSKTSNQIKTWLLILLFPVLLGGAIFVVFYFIAKNAETSQMQIEFALQSTLEFMPLLLAGLAIWMVIAFFFQRQLMFAFSGAKVVTRAQEPELYNLIENLCISRGLSVPRIGIIEEAGMNAFALGRRASDSRVVFTRGLLNNLEKREIEAVAAHELTHIINKDSLLMLVMVLYIGAISIAGEVLIRFGGRSSSSDEKKGNPLPLIGFALIILGYIAYPLIRLAISRRREFLADAGAVEITKDNQAMISALRKISQNPDLDLDNKEMASMFIANPLGKIDSLLQTHPSIEERIEALKHY